MSVLCEVRAGQLTVRGMSLAGVQTCIHVPQLDLLFDCGHCPRSVAGTNRLLLSHGHVDHCAGVVGLLGLRELGAAPRALDIHAPSGMIEPLRAAIAAYESIQPFPFRYDLHAAVPGADVRIGQRLCVRPFRSVHVVETLGYTVWESVTKLRAELLHLPGAEIASRKQAGEDLFNEIERPILSYPADTGIEVLDREPHLLESRVLVLEATYIDDRRTPAQCASHGHVHLDQVVERAESFGNEHLILTHFSQSYSPATCHQIVRERCNGRFRPEVHVFAPPSGSWPG